MNRGFKGVWIPREIWLRKDLTCVEKCMLAEIESLSGVAGNDIQGCFASNEWFSENLGVSRATVTRGVAKLIDLEFIKLTMEPTAKGTRRILYPLLKLSIPPTQNEQTPSTQIEHHIYKEEFKEKTIPPLKPPQGGECAKGILFDDLPEQVVRDGEEDFNIFWAHWPKKEDKQKAKKKFLKLHKEKVMPDIDTLVAIVEVHKRTDRWQKGFIPGPAVWLGNSRWDDEVTAEETSEERAARLLEESKI